MVDKEKMGFEKKDAIRKEPSVGKIKQAQCLLYLKTHAKSSNFYITQSLLFFTTFFCARGINADGEGMQMEKAAILCNQMRTRKAAFF